MTRFSWLNVLQKKNGSPSCREITFEVAQKSYVVQAITCYERIALTCRIMLFATQEKLSNKRSQMLLQLSVVWRLKIYFVNTC